MFKVGSSGILLGRPSVGCHIRSDHLDTQPNSEHKWWDFVEQTKHLSRNFPLGTQSIVAAYRPWGAFRVWSLLAPLSLLALLAWAHQAAAQAAPVGVSCVSYLPPVGTQQCTSTTGKISLSTENGTAEDANYLSAKRLIIEIIGPSNAGDMANILVQTELPLTAGGRPILQWAGGAPTLVPAQTAATSLSPKDAIVISDASSGVRSLTVNVSGGASGQSAGNAVVVADSLQSLTINSNGYNGQPGQDPLVSLAADALGSTHQQVSGTMAAAYTARRQADQANPVPTVGLPFDSTDLNNYAANGLSCRTDETAVCAPSVTAASGCVAGGSYAYDSAVAAGLDPSKVPASISVTAFSQEQAKRSFCQRSPEFTATQQCRAQLEYGFQAACQVVAESRSVEFAKRSPVIWNRALCGGQNAAQVRRKVVRTAFVDINVPGVKAYHGPITSTLTFAQTYDLYRPNCATDQNNQQSCLSKLSGGASDTQLQWYNPFWTQSSSILQGTTIAVSTAKGPVQDDYNDPAFPPTVAGWLVAAKEFFIPRTTDLTTSTDKSQTLYSFLGSPAGGTPVKDLGGATLYTVTGCAKVVDASAARYSVGGQNLSNPGTPKVYPGGQFDLATYNLYLEFFQSFDANTVGFNEATLKIPGTSVVVSNCYAYEVMDAVVPSNVVPGTWSLSSGTPEPALGQPATVSFCPQADMQIIGSETFLQYNDESVCYVQDPRQPPAWLYSFKGLNPASATSGNFAVSDLSSNVWSDLWGATGGPQTVNLNKEFTFPSSVPASVSSAFSATSGDWADYCLLLPTGAMTPWFDVGSLVGSQTLTRSRVVPVFNYNQGASVAVPTGQAKKVCDSGIRLDAFLASVPRPSCPAGTTTNLQVSSYSNLSSDPVWTTWSQQLAKSPTALQVPANYALRSELTDTRYDDLPGQILTTLTPNVSPTQFVPAGQSFSGQAFPPTYAPTVQLNGTTARSYPGWVRELDLVTPGGATVAPSNFTPYGGTTLESRGTTWCNAAAFAQNPDGTIATSYGARGIMRDAAKRTFGFTYDDLSAAPASVASRAYVGIEIVGTGVQSSSTTADGFYPLSKALAGPNGQGGLDANSMNTNLTSEAFRVSNYPYIGARYPEVCQAGQLFNQFTGFCHAPTTPWVSSSHVVNRLLPDGKTRQQWNIPLSYQTLAITTTTLLDIPLGQNSTNQQTTMPGDPNNLICPSKMSAGLAPLNNCQTSNNPVEYFQLGFLRPMASMVPWSSSLGQTLLDRPETVDQMVYSPGFGESRTQQSPICNRSFRMIAVPVPDAGNANSGVSVLVDRSNFLPGLTDSAGKYWPPLFLQVDTVCPNGVLEFQTAIRAYNGSQAAQRLFLDPVAAPTLPGSTNSPNFGPSVNQTVLDDALPNDPQGQGNITMTFYPPAGAQNVAAVGRIRDISESVAAGGAATTGAETLRLIAIQPPTVRQRGTTAGGLTWQPAVTTGESVTGTQQTVQPLSCTPANISPGVWTAAPQVSQPVASLTGSAIITLAAAPSGQAISAIVVGGGIQCDQCGLPAGTTVLGISGVSVTVSQPATLTAASATATFVGIIETNGPAVGSNVDCSASGSTCALTAEELGLFSIVVPNSRALRTTRPAATQFTPWSFELTSDAPVDQTYTHTQPFGSWTILSQGSDPASVPSCAIFNSDPSAPNAPDVLLPRQSLSSLASLTVAAGINQLIKMPTVMSPLPTLLGRKNLLSLPVDQDLQKSQGCVAWDSVTGATCTAFVPTVGGPEGASLVFGGAWQQVFVDTRQRLSQECHSFVRNPDSSLSGQCQTGLETAAVLTTQQTAGTTPSSVCTPPSSSAALCAPCQDNPQQMCPPYVQPKGSAVTASCTTLSCPFPLTTQTYQVDSSVAVSGGGGEDGTNSGGATVFCRDCPSVQFTNKPGSGGVGAAPVSSSRSETLTCMSWNHNSLAPTVTVRNLWSQPFIGGNAGQNGRAGQSGGALQLYQDMTPEAIYQISDPNWWQGKPKQ